MTILREVSKCLAFSRKPIVKHFYMAKWTLMYTNHTRHCDPAFPQWRPGHLHPDEGRPWATHGHWMGSDIGSGPFIQVCHWYWHRYGTDIGTDMALILAQIWYWYWHRYGPDIGTDMTLILAQIWHWYWHRYGADIGKDMALILA